MITTRSIHRWFSYYYFLFFEKRIDSVPRYRFSVYIYRSCAHVCIAVMISKFSAFSPYVRPGYHRYFPREDLISPSRSTGRKKRLVFSTRVDFANIVLTSDKKTRLKCNHLDRLSELLQQLLETS